MKNLRILAAAFLVFVAPVHAQPTDQSIEELMTITSMESLTDSMMTQMEQVLRQSMSAAAQGKPLTPEQRKALDAMPAKLVEAMRSEMNWQVMKPIYITVYKESFTQEEVDGLVAFYKTPVGRSTIQKMPLVMQRSMQLTQAHMQSLLPKIDAAMKQAMKEAGVTQ